MSVASVLNNPAVTAAIGGPRTMAQLSSQLPAVEVVLSEDVPDRVEEIVPPGTNFRWPDAGYAPPLVADTRARRRAR